jgi:hypothetical protein
VEKNKMLQVVVTGMALAAHLPQDDVKGGFPTICDESADSPLTTLLDWTGYGDHRVFLDAGTAGGFFSSTITVEGLSEIAQVEQAWFIVDGWQFFQKDAVLEFAGVDLGTADSQVIDTFSSLFNYHLRWDVTDQVAFNGEFPYQISDLDISYVRYLLVVFSDPNLPRHRILISDGAEVLGAAASLNSFDFAEAGVCKMEVLLEAGDDDGDSEEFLAFNGYNLLPPPNPFDSGSTGYNFFTFPDVPLLSGNNSLVVSTGQDVISFHLITFSLELNTSTEVTSVEDFQLLENFPNPFNPETQIAFTIPRQEKVRLVVFDTAGRPVRTLVDGLLSAGKHQVVFDASGLPSGLYFYQLRAGEFQDVRKMVSVK